MHHFTDGCSSQYKSRHCMGAATSIPTELDYKCFTKHIVAPVVTQLWCFHCHTGQVRISPYITPSLRNRFSVPYSRINAYMYSFFPRTTRLWNNLPHYRVSSPDLDAFRVVPCGGGKTSPRTSTIVQFIFYFWSFEISVNILRNQKWMIGLDSYSRQVLII